MTYHQRTTKPLDGNSVECRSNRTQKETTALKTLKITAAELLR